MRDGKAVYGRMAELENSSEDQRKRLLGEKESEREDTNTFVFPLHTCSSRVKPWN